MRILAVDSSAKTASAVIVDENADIISESFVNAGLTHSQTLMPMIDSVLSLSKLKVSDIDFLAVTNGPGSFTGIRIGIAAVKGLALPNNIKCFGISTLEAMAYNLLDDDCIACCAMDARCAQVYAALFRCKGGKVERLSADDAIPAAELVQSLGEYGGEKIVCIGDGARIAYEAIKDSFSDVRIAQGLTHYQRAWGAACAALRKDKEAVNAGELLPVYLRLSQAERELKRRENA